MKYLFIFIIHDLSVNCKVQNWRKTEDPTPTALTAHRLASESTSSAVNLPYNMVLLPVILSASLSVFSNSLAWRSSFSANSFSFRAFRRNSFGVWSTIIFYFVLGLIVLRQPNLVFWFSYDAPIFLLLWGL